MPQKLPKSFYFRSGISGYCDHKEVWIIRYIPGRLDSSMKVCMREQISLTEQNALQIGQAIPVLYRTDTDSYF